MQTRNMLSALMAAALVATLGNAAGAQVIVRGYYPPPAPPPIERPYAERGPLHEQIYLGHAHVDGTVDHDDIRVDRYAGRFHAIELRVVNAPIRFDRVVIHYGDGEVEVLPVAEVISTGESSHWINLPGGDRHIRSLELWYARAQPELPVRPEVQLFGRP